MPERIVPMLADAGRMPLDESRYSFEVKWDGVRAIAYCKPGRIRLESRNLNEITDAYPEVRGILFDLGMREAVLDGEIVAFDDAGKPSFERLQSRMHVTSPSAVKRLSKSTPVVYAIFDLLHLDGETLMALPYEQRRERLEALGLGGPAWRVPAVQRGAGARLLAATEQQGLEGVVAKRLDSRYEPGRRTGAWIKIKHLRRQELVIGGWLPGEGRRTDRIGALLMGYHADGGLKLRRSRGDRIHRADVDRVDPAAEAAAERRQPVRQPAQAPAQRRVRLARTGGRGRVPRVDRRGRDARPVVQGAARRQAGRRGRARARQRRPDRGTRCRAGAGAGRLTGARPEELFDDVVRRPDGALAVNVDGRALKLTNWDKVLYPETGFTKGDLIAYYARIAPTVVTHLKDRPLTLKRYPNGVDSPYFYEKQSPSHRPEWVETVKVQDVEYTLAQDRATLVWLANLADIELHTSLSLRADPLRPTMLVFDLDPGAPAGLVECSEVALVLRGLFEALGLTSVVKTSGSKGMQVYVPLNTEITYEQTKPFAKTVAELLEQRLPELVVSRMTKRLRPGRVLVDWSQNDRHKTTVNVYSLRARPTPSVSTPVSWDEVRRCRDAGDAELLDFGPGEVLQPGRRRRRSVRAAVVGRAGAAAPVAAVGRR